MVEEMLKCPNCGTRVKISNIRHRFVCGKCGIGLESNFYLVLAVLVLGWSVLVPLLSIQLAPKICDGSSVCYGLVEAAIGACVILPIAYLLIRVKKAE